MNQNWKGGVSEDNMRYRKRFVQQNPDIVRIERETLYKIQGGVILRKPCKVCGNRNSEAHHPDYTTPDKVVWLCRTHHVRANRER